MEKAVLYSIQPIHCANIANLKKLLEIRKTIPKLKPPFKAYIYCTNNKRQYLRKLGTSIQEIFITENRDVLGRTEKVKSLIGDVSTFWEIGGYNGKVIGEFICDRIDTYEMEGYSKTENVYQAIKSIEHDEDIDDEIQYTIATNEMTPNELLEIPLLKQSCLTFDEIGKYVCGKKDFGFHTFYGIHISDLVIYDKPKELGEFYTVCKLNCEHCEQWGYTRVNADEFDMDCKSDWFNHKPLTRAPQSWCYVEELKG